MAWTDITDAVKDDPYSYQLHNRILANLNDLNDRLETVEGSGGGGAVPTQSATYSLTLTSDTADDTEGGYSQVVASTGFAVTNVVLQAVNGGSALLVDLSTGAESAEVAKISDLAFPATSSDSTVYPIPFTIPISTRVAMRVKKTGSGDSVARTLAMRVILLG